MYRSKGCLSLFLSQRDFVVDPTAIKLLNDKQLVRLWNSRGDLIYYNELLRKATSYSPLDLCYYDLKTLWSFEDDGYDRFKSIVLKTMMGQELGKNCDYIVRENRGERLFGHHNIDIATPVWNDGKIEGILIAGTCDVYKKAG
ncbi:MAG: hypothetical protein KUL82_14675 [Bdellovibrio sp.]|nr:hypothetical protein [Bdellovibrio sp.]